MTKIYKYEVSAKTRTRLEARMPRGAKILDVQSQGGVLVCWAEVDTEAPPVTRAFHAVFTGDIPPPGCVYLKTDQITHAGLVYHFYYDPEEYNA
jgi:hypothetical protein